jgi:hypothetical protein
VEIGNLLRNAIESSFHIGVIINGWGQSGRTYLLDPWTCLYLFNQERIVANILVGHIG